MCAWGRGGQREPNGVVVVVVVFSLGGGWLLARSVISVKEGGRADHRVVLIFGKQLLSIRNENEAIHHHHADWPDGDEYLRGGIR